MLSEKGSRPGSPVLEWEESREQYVHAKLISDINNVTFVLKNVYTRVQEAQKAAQFS